jgi:hypothetical protein
VREGAGHPCASQGRAGHRPPASDGRSDHRRLSGVPELLPELGQRPGQQA